MKNANHAIIFIPGFKGSVLLNEDKKMIWPNILRAQFFHDSLNYDLPELNIQNKHHYHDTDILGSIPIIPHLLELDVYSGFINELTRRYSNQIKVIPFHYDWRASLIKTASILNNLIIELKQQGIKKVDLICHSMGGLIGSYLLTCYSNYGKTNHSSDLISLFNKVYFIATPFQGAMKALKDITHGNQIGFNHTLLSQISLVSFPSIYYLLPLHDKMIRHVNRGEILSLIDFNTWDALNLDILNQHLIPKEIYNKRKKYITDCISSAIKFRSLIHEQNINILPDTMKSVCITSNHFKSVSGLEINKKSGLNWKYDKGDGSIPHNSTTLPDIFSNTRVKHYNVKSEHSKMLSSCDTQNIVWDEIENEL